MSREPKYYSVLQPENSSADHWVLMFEVPGTGPNCHVGVFISRERALEFAADFDDYLAGGVNSQHWYLIGTYLNPDVSTTINNMDTKQLQ